MYGQQTLDFIEKIEIERVFEMPNSETFSIFPIRQFILDNIKKDWYIADPFARNNNIANITNDLDPETSAFFHMDALEFLKNLEDESIDCVLYDPPYSPRQIKECYTKMDKSVSLSDTNSSFWCNQKKEIARCVKPGGVVFTFGWNSNGIGKKYGFQMKKILIVNHGGMHNDTICTMEVKVSSNSNFLTTKTKRGKNEQSLIQNQERPHKVAAEDYAHRR